MVIKRYPEQQWEQITASESGFDPERFSAIKNWLDQQPPEKPYRVVIIRHGCLVAEWNYLMSRDEQQPMASAAKSIYSCILGSAIEEGVIHSADDKLSDYYPEAFEIPEGYGPKPGRYAFDKDREITLRQLISNTSGYMKPGETPGKVFHYQTFGMNVLTHAIAKSYDLYDISDPVGSPGLKVLIHRMIGKPIGASWGYSQGNFDHPPAARINIFGYNDGVKSTALDMARLGWLWCNWGKWRDKQLIPETWLREAARTAPDIVANVSKDKWKYGYGFWTNDHGQLFPNLPRDSFSAQGAGSQQIWVCPSQDLVVVQSPGTYHKDEENDTGLLKMIVDALSG